MGILSTVFVVVLLAISVLVVATYARKGPTREDFEDVAEAPAQASQQYGLRLYVIKVFDTMFHRNPTHNALEKYSVGPSEQEVMKMIVADFERLTHAPPEQPVLVTPPPASSDEPKKKVDGFEPAPTPQDPPSTGGRAVLKQRLKEARRCIDEALDLIYES